MSTLKMSDLLAKQEEERKELAHGVFQAWQPIGKRERELLSGYDNKFENAPLNVQSQIVQAREKFFDEWGSDGKLAALMEARHAKEREKVIKREVFITNLNEHLGNKDRGR